MVVLRNVSLAKDSADIKPNFLFRASQGKITRGFFLKKWLTL
ncbi:hypothetical protein Pcac1_g5488 [Phytophthora cactorum]|nr:hypothetical protein Pcac1_g5488 [Phytophthora cactorum]